MSNRLEKVLIIGAGVAGQRHMQAQLDLGSQVAIYEEDKKIARLVQGQNPGIEIFDSISEGIARSTAVYICTPDYLHTDYAATAIKSRKAVYCEKPLTTSLEEAEYLQELVHQYGVKFIVGNINRLTPAFLEIKQRVDRGDLGRLLFVRTSYLHDMREYQKQTKWRVDQNILYGGGSHPIDLAMWVLGEPLQDVSAMSGPKVIPGYTKPEDYHILLQSQSGIVAEVSVNAALKLPVHKVDLEVYGETGSLLADNKSGVIKSYLEGQSNEFQVERFGNPFTFPIAARVFNDFISGRTNNHYPLPDIDETMPVMRAMDQVEKYLDQRAKVVLG